MTVNQIYELFIFTMKETWDIQIENKILLLSLHLFGKVFENIFN